MAEDKIDKRRKKTKLRVQFLNEKLGIWFELLMGWVWGVGCCRKSHVK
ncbi:uncharacterized protein G2W53_033906 [Senna tora]|uniref:Uncharacterized protein n=1 Tax=Senna tora TaxID=362788 RepID=A0A834W7E3_9FABA|nr:uncharacterized protein G2W53_033906 [Senna tora]